MDRCGNRDANVIQNGVVLRLIGKWLNEGVWEEGILTHEDEGTRREV